MMRNLNVLTVINGTVLIPTLLQQRRLPKARQVASPQEDIKKAILEALKGAGDYREMYVMATSFNNQPLATCLEFTLDPKTLTFYASSEKQTEKLFHIAANPRASMVYVRARNDMKYFLDPLGVQIVGRAVQLKHLNSTANGTKWLGNRC
jgi:nitroimidazol reductase NimA-like FMN-containing flavoprotein (pyridoxamine 5'-phosphate oxidase superfamily)